MTLKSRWFFVLFGIIIFIFPLWLAYRHFWLPKPNRTLLENKPSVVSCQKDSDCYSNKNKKEVGIKYFCKNNQCQKEFLNNPAEVECQKNKGLIKERVNFQRKKYKVCLFPDKSECEIWKFLQKECFIGEFNPNDDYWEGYFKTFRGAKYNNYFLMLNGEAVGIDSENAEITEFINFFQDKDVVLKLKGKIVPNNFEPNNKILLVEKITNKEELISAKDSFTPESSFVKEDIVAKPIDEKPTSSLSVYPDDSLYGCQEYAFAKKCSSLLEPVCAKIVTSAIKEADISPLPKAIWKDFSNPCQACLFQEKDSKIEGYLMGKCENINFDKIK